MIAEISAYSNNHTRAMQLYFRWISFKWHIAGIKKKIQLKIDLLAGDFSYRTDTSTVMAVILRFISSVLFLHILFTFDFSLFGNLFTMELNSLALPNMSLGIVYFFRIYRTVLWFFIMS